MKKLYNKSELTFSLMWIALYVTVMNIALQFCNGFDNLSDKTEVQLLVPVICSIIYAICITVWIIKNKLTQKYGLCRFKKCLKKFLYFIPLIIMSCVNLSNGLELSSPLTVALLMSLNLAIGGYIEEIIFRGFLFKALSKDSLKSAVIISAITFGAGHIVNIFNTADYFAVFLQISYAVAVGFLYTVIVYKGGSIWPCILSHMFVNATSVFAQKQGVFSDLVFLIFKSDAQIYTDLCSAVLIILISGSYALWIWKKT
jgi:membrane protease YdiL (CAAX protease family)